MNQHAARTSPSWMPSKSTAKAVVATLAAVAAYLMGVLPADGGLGDVTVVQWLGLIVALAGTYGVTYTVSNAPPR